MQIPNFAPADKAVHLKNVVTQLGFASMHVQFISIVHFSKYQELCAIYGWRAKLKKGFRSTTVATNLKSHLRKRKENSHFAL